MIIHLPYQWALKIKISIRYNNGKKRKIAGHVLAVAFTGFGQMPQN
jgi:hypothetical protein